jgi:hypothetical protein
MRYQTALHPDAFEHLEIAYEFLEVLELLSALMRNGIAPNSMDGNPEFPEKFPWRSWGSLI